MALKGSDLKIILSTVRPEDSSKWLFDLKRPGFPLLPPEVPDSIYDIKSEADIMKLQAAFEKYSVSISFFGHLGIWELKSCTFFAGRRSR